MIRRTLIVLAILILPVFLGISLLQQKNLKRGQSLLLAAYTDPINQIAVSVHLTRNLNDLFFLAAEFNPPSGYHLYSKDLPRNGLNGQGRPTLLELPPTSRIQSAGVLAESVSSAMVSYQPDGPSVYPDGPVTLTLPIKLPPVTGWVKDQISLTYMACSESDCKVPTVGKLITVSIPGALTLMP
jgi:hypothetical protein